ncbi:MAG: DedA family protein [Candidatus Binatia bacterium]
MVPEALLGWVIAYGYVGIFVLLMLGIIGIPIPDEGVLTLAGYLCCKGDLLLIPTIAAAFLGSACGVTVSYALGWTVGNSLVSKYGHFVHITPQQVDQAHRWFTRVGRWGLLFGYFLPGVRHLTAFAAGAAKLERSVFAPFTYTGGFVWSVTFVSVGYVVGKEWTHVAPRLYSVLVLSSGGVVICFLLYVLARFRGKERADRHW